MVVAILHMPEKGRRSDAVYFLETDRLPNATTEQLEFIQDLHDQRVDRIEISQNQFHKKLGITGALVDLPAVVRKLVAIVVTAE